MLFAQTHLAQQQVLRRVQLCPARPPALTRQGRKEQRRGAVAAKWGKESEQTLALASSPVGVAQKEEEMLLPLPLRVESPVDDPALHNPLQRAQRLGTAWFGVVLEWEGVIVQSSEQEHLQAWMQVAQEFDYKKPLGQALRRTKGVRDEVIVSRIFGWSHNPIVARQVAQRKAEVYEQLLGGRPPVAMLEARPFLEMLKKNGIPIALAAPLPEAKVEEALARLSLRPFFDAVVTAEDAGTAEMEYYFALSAQKLARPPLRCIVVGDSNASVESAHELGMKSIIVSGTNPVYDFGSADCVVKTLNNINFMNLRKQFGAEELVEPRLPFDELDAMEKAQRQADADEAAAMDTTDMDDYGFDDDDDNVPSLGAFGSSSRMGSFSRNNNFQ